MKSELNPKQIKAFFIVVLFFAIMGALTSCSEDYYYLQVNDYNEESVCINIVDKDDNIIVILDKNVDIHSNPTEIIMELNTQMGFESPYKASEAYWRIVK